MRCTLDQLYERLLFTYPPAYRAARGHELVATAMDLARPGQRLPGVREAAGFVIGGLRTRSRLVRVGSSAMIWADGLRLGAAIIMAVAFAGQVNNLLFTTRLQSHLLPAAMAGVIVALLRWPRRIVLLVVAAGMGLVWGRVSSTWSFFTAARFNHIVVESGPSLIPALIVDNILPWVVPFLLAAVALIWQPRARRGPAVWPWWFVGLMIFVPSVEILKGVSTALYSVPAVAVSLSFVQVAWPLPVLGFAFLTREARLGVAVAAWAGSSLLIGGVRILLPAPGMAWFLLDPGIFVVWLISALATTALVSRRLAHV